MKSREKKEGQGNDIDADEKAAIRDNQTKKKSKSEEDVVSIAPDLSHLTPEQQEIILAQTKLPDTKKDPSYLDLYTFATPLERCLNVLGLLAAVAAGVCQPLMIFILGDLITDFVSYTTAVNTNENIPGARADLSNGVKDGALYLVYIAIAMFACTYTYMGIWSYNGEKTARRIREQYFKAVLRQNIGFWETIGPGEITTRLTTDMSLVQRGISEKIPIMAQYLTQLAAGFTVAFIK